MATSKKKPASKSPSRARTTKKSDNAGRTSPPKKKVAAIAPESPPEVASGAKGGRKLSVKEELYIEHLLQGKSQSEAARLAGFDQTPAALAVTASRMLRRAKVQERIKERIEQAQINTLEIIGTLLEHMRGSMEDFYEFNDWGGHPQINLTLARDLGILHLVNEISYDQNGKPKLKLYDAQKAATQLSRIAGLDKSRQTNITLTLEQIDKLLAEKEGQK